MVDDTKPEKTQKPKRLKWFFKEPRRTSCYVSFSVAMGEAEVRAVVRHFDGDWHFLSEASVNGTGDSLAVAELGFIADTHPEILPLYGLEPGWAATWDASTNFWEKVEMDESWTKIAERPRD